MRRYKYNIPAGESRTLTAAGTFVRGLSGSDPYHIQVDGGAAIPFETGIAFEVPEGFSQLIINNTAADAQEIEIAISPAPVFDNRLVGQMDLNGAIGILTTAAVGHNTPAKQTIVASTQVLAANTDRRSALVQIDGACYIDSSANGVLMPVGSFTWESQTALTLVPVPASVEVRILEETNV